MNLKKHFFQRTKLKKKQFAGENGGNAMVEVPENTEFELVGKTFVSANTSIHLEITCRKDPYRDFEADDRELKKAYPVQPVQKLRARTVIHVLPDKKGYEADIYNERNDQAITILIGPENPDNFSLLLNMIRSAQFI